jgi:hypothetical protein
MFYDDQGEILNNPLLVGLGEDSKDENEDLGDDKKEEDNFNPEKISEPEELDILDGEFSDGNY